MPENSEQAVAPAKKSPMDVLNSLRGATPPAEPTAEKAAGTPDAAPQQEETTPVAKPEAAAAVGEKKDELSPALRHRLAVQSAKIVRQAEEIERLKKLVTPAAPPAKPEAPAEESSEEEPEDEDKSKGLFDYLNGDTPMTEEEEKKALEPDATPPATDNNEYIEHLKQKEADEQFAALLIAKRANYPDLTDEATNRAVAKMVTDGVGWAKLDLYLAAAERDILSGKVKNQATQIDKARGDISAVSAHGAPPAAAPIKDPVAASMAVLEAYRAKKGTQQ